MSEQPDIVQMLNDLHHDLVVVMQAAWIEWRRGGDAEKAMLWIENTLAGPGLIPDEDEPHSGDAQMYFNLNRAKPGAPCGVCGRPTHIRSRNGAACSWDHMNQIDATADGGGGVAV